MIGDSTPWKQELLAIALRLERRATQRRWTSRTAYLVERDVMVGAFSARKLLDSYKVSQTTEVESVPVRAARLTGEPSDAWTRSQFFEHYDVANPKPESLSLRDLTNQLIHSTVFSLSATDTEPPLFDGVIVASDLKVESRVYFVPVASVVRAFRSIGEDEPLAWQMERDAKGRRTIKVYP
ncbi:hypothetical protein GCM10009740_16690 [Terrabacter terrae]|uniref:Uncharacterized protein n=1 Tax=Terrabacter terrae TaxID=318434 RepID=A0ABP5FJC0_9MICO